MIFASTVISAALHLGTIGTCDPVDGPRQTWSRAQRSEVRARVRAAGASLGAAPHVLAYLDVIAVRESSLRPSVRHTLGAREAGLGVLGLDVRSHSDKWPGDPDPDWCTPEASVVVALEVMRRAVTRWGALDLAHVQSVYALGHGRSEDLSWVRAIPGLGWLVEALGVELVTRRPAPTPNLGRLCDRLRARGVSCRAPVGLADLGRGLPLGQRDTWARGQAKSFGLAR